MSALALYELTAEERHLAMMAYGCAYEWAVEYCDATANPEDLANTFATRPWLLMGYERDTATYTGKELRIVREYFYAGIRNGQWAADQIARENHRRFHSVVQATARSRFASYAELEAYRKRVVA
ncbi:MAG: hypothetical protein LKJ18_03950 [Ancrocorticia sp.]|jgi:hypothetical protein|nr:hypothetical protein [Ancrocorticia sp.]MCI2003092.1 hypothetical protein [Ancrocorticia sp.]